VYSEKFDVIWTALFKSPKETSQDVYHWKADLRQSNSEAFNIQLDFVLLPTKLLNIPVTLELVDVQTASQEQRQSLVQLNGHNVKNPAAAIGSLAPGLVGSIECHRLNEADS
jgi:hypothetical protein